VLLLEGVGRCQNPGKGQN